MKECRQEGKREKEKIRNIRKDKKERDEKKKKEKYIVRKNNSEEQTVMQKKETRKVLECLKKDVTESN